MATYSGSNTRRSRLFHNDGKLNFTDVSQKVGLPVDLPGYGLSAADVNNDGWPDFFIAANDGGNLLFLNDGHGKFREAPFARDTFSWPGSGGANLITGITLADVNRDGLIDAVMGPHYREQWLNPQAIRLYLNRGIIDGVPQFEDVTSKAGLKPMPLKAPNVEV